MTLFPLFFSIKFLLFLQGASYGNEDQFYKNKTVLIGAR